MFILKLQTLLRGRYVSKSAQLVELVHLDVEVKEKEELERAETLYSSCAR